MEKFRWYEPTEKLEFVEKQTNDLLRTLLNAGAQFYSYCGHQIMYLKGQVIDLFRKNEVLTLLRSYNYITNMQYELKTVVYLKQIAEPLYRPIPEGILGMNEPKLRMTHSLHTSMAEWIKEIIESGKLSQTQGE